MVTLTAEKPLGVSVLRPSSVDTDTQLVNELHKPGNNQNDLSVTDTHGPTKKLLEPSVRSQPVIMAPSDEPNGRVDATEGRRKSVQFARDTEDNEEHTATRPHQPAQVAERADHHNKGYSIYSKLKALAIPAASGLTHSIAGVGTNASAGAPDNREADGMWSPRSERNEPYFPMMVEEDGTGADADAEESASEVKTDQSLSRKKRKQLRRAGIEGVVTAPVSPQQTKPEVTTTHDLTTESAARPGGLSRRATDTDMSENARQGVSDDELQRRGGHESPWRRRATWRGLSYTSGSRKPGERTPEGQRPNALRSLTHVGSATEGSESRPEGNSSRLSRRKLITERGATASAQKWRQIKTKIQLLGQGKRRDRTIDHEKSAELLAELLAGSPAALMAASMFQRDEHGSRRIPILLEQLKVKITDSEVDKHREKDNPNAGDRHMIFRIELEYGNGVNRMKWVVKRSLRDFANMHIKYKLHFSKQKYVKLKATDKNGMPHFPKSAFPYLRLYRGLEDEAEDDEDEHAETGEASTNAGERPGPKHRHATSLGIHHRRPSTGITAGGVVGAAVAAPGGIAQANLAGGAKRDPYAERQRKKLEIYLQKMIKFMLFRPDSNRLCKFLEVSALGVRLAAEGTYHGKEGFLVIRSGKGVDFRKALTPSNFSNRHMPKWFLVRHSYVVCVDSPEEMHIYDVFLFDSEFSLQFSSKRAKDQNAKELATNTKEAVRHPQHHRLKLQNSERVLSLLARNERQLAQFEESIRTMTKDSPWVKRNRFESFAPVRANCFAQWLVDGRDHMWVVSRAINQAKDVIYIHDWWLSPEIYMRRPAAISQKWRLDRLLKRKAEQGVKVFVIVYRNIESAIPIDSQYTKFSLLDLHPNVFVQRSPNQFRQNTFFWAHHEKLCIIDHTLAFVGGIDLCFGRWDTPQHPVADDKPTGFESNDLPKDTDHCQLWSGKDYSNPRVQDFYNLNKPYEEMYNRSQIARMPWHDISMQVVGQPARDLTRHFVQRWNYILRQRKPTRPTPFLIPPPDFNPADLEALGLDGTCEVQILRSAGPWSLGTPDKTECSIMNAYCKIIENSEHFVYIENQFFISSCETDATQIRNSIGDALVERIIRAAKNEEAWRAVLVIPLIPGFQNTVEQEGGTSVRLIMQYQYRSICRGESSIFSRLRAKGIEPEDYIRFYALRQWGKIGPQKTLVTEQLYVHAKCMVVDDRVAIIGSANINERSMLGNRDSECAAVVRDTDLIWSRMNGEPYQVGRFPHTLRMRLMREHLGLDVDKIMEEAQIMEAEQKRTSTEEAKSPANDFSPVQSPSAMLESDSRPSSPGHGLKNDLLERQEVLHSFNHDVDWEQKNNPNLITGRKLTEDTRVTNNPAHRQDVGGEGFDHMREIQDAGYGVGRDTLLVKGSKEVLMSDLLPEGRATLQSPMKLGEIPRLPTYVQEHELGEPAPPPRPEAHRLSTAQLGLPMLSQLPELPAMDDTDIGGPALAKAVSNGSNDCRHPLAAELKRPYIDRDCMQDPIRDFFLDDTWDTVAENNTKIYRAIFRCMPDNEVRNWTQYKEYLAYDERFKHMQGNDAALTGKAVNRAYPRSASSSGPPGAGVKGATTAGVKAAGRFNTVGDLPAETEKKASVLKEKLAGLKNADKKDETDDPEKEKLRIWAADANRAQMVRQSRSLSRTANFTAQDEKAVLETVPEAPTASQMLTEDLRADSTTEAALSSPSTTATEKSPQPPPFVGYSDAVNMTAQPHTRRRRGPTWGSRRTFKASDDIPSQVEAEGLLNMVQGHLVTWPYDWLDKVEAGGNWLYPFDQISPIEI